MLKLYSWEPNAVKRCKSWTGTGKRMVLVRIVSSPWFQRITGEFRLKGTSGDFHSNPCSKWGQLWGQTRLLGGALSRLKLKTSKDGDFTSYVSDNQWFNIHFVWFLVGLFFPRVHGVVAERRSLGLIQKLVGLPELSVFYFCIWNSKDRCEMPHYYDMKQDS